MEDGSSDCTLEVARSFSDPRISVFTDHSHRGLVSRLNRAIEMSRGKYFARMYGDIENAAQKKGYSVSLPDNIIQLSPVLSSATRSLPEESS